MALFYILISALSVLAFYVAQKAITYLRRTRRKSRKQNGMASLNVAVDPLFKQEIEEACRKMHQEFGVKETFTEFALRALDNELLKFDSAHHSVEQMKRYIQQRDICKHNREYRLIQKRKQYQEGHGNYIEKQCDYSHKHGNYVEKGDDAGKYEAGDHRGSGIPTPKTKDDNIGT